MKKTKTKNSTEQIEDDLIDLFSRFASITIMIFNRAKSDKSFEDQMMRVYDMFNAQDPRIADLFDKFQEKVDQFFYDREELIHEYRMFKRLDRIKN